MNPYRVLKLEELAPLETEFIQFLSANGIDAPGWEKIVAHIPEEMNELLSQFSRIVWEKILDKIDILEKLDGQILYLVKFGPLEALLIGIEFPEDSDAFHLGQIPDDQKITLGQNNIRCFSVIKSYKKSRAEEMYFLVELGYLVSEKKDLFQSLADQMGLIDA